MLRKFHGETVVRRFVQTGNESFNKLPGKEFKTYVLCNLVKFNAHDDWKMDIGMLIFGFSRPYSKRSS
jgi:hypothetical protein